MALRSSRKKAVPLPVRLHRGDIMSVATRSAVMSRIRGKGTKPERAVAELMAGAGLRWEEHCKDLPGRPDFVLRDLKIAIFVDGDFWHGWRFPAWRLKLSEHWERKIEGNIRRDIRNFRALRRGGWKVIRIWEHQIRKSPARCLERILLERETRDLADCRPAWHGEPERRDGGRVRKSKSPDERR
jgi:DNA mismatch endonuclease, patch repair protein